MFSGPLGDDFGKFVSVIGIIDAFSCVRAEIGDFVAFVHQPFGKLGLKVSGGVIGCNGYTHARYIVAAPARLHPASIAFRRMWQSDEHILLAFARAAALVLKMIVGHLLPTGSKHVLGTADMRSIIAAIFLALMAIPAWSAALAEPGTEVERITRASALGSGNGAVVISIRSEIYLDEPLDVYFLREGGSITNDADVIRFVRKQGFLAFGNDTLRFKIRAFQVPAGTYRLVAHGMECPKIPEADERCLIEEPGFLGRGEVSRPSRGYGEDAPSFEVREGHVTIAGDFALTSRNTIEWSEIPAEEVRSTERRFARLQRAPDPVVPESFRLKYGLFPRSYEDDRNRRY